eukprot:TRINITY_DN5118_c0_g3_i1.p1 TRINITY_DN5118_c0_g3~~TRINITY_DN5118_c0_g3_i1.p1  ORF type:complete len:124 (+),score=12.54 TRINITY_DN5118_c0_g3_i1:387-758(+)
MLVGSNSTAPLIMEAIDQGHYPNTEQQLNLIQPITNKEVKNIMFSINVNKSPGPDGYNSGFFKFAWDIVGEEITEVVREFFQRDTFPKSLNSTLISLIPKVDAPSTPSDYRLIAYCNTLYKCI